MERIIGYRRNIEEKKENREAIEQVEKNCSER